jgi:hypothetical protein
MKPLLTATLTLFLSFTAFAQSETVSEFIRKHEPSASFYLYSSTLRMMNPGDNPDFQRLVRHIEKISLLIYDKNAEINGRQSLGKLQKSLAAEAYEELLSFEDAGNRIYIYARGDDPEAYVSLLDNTEALMLFDMEGAPHLPSLMKLVNGEFDFNMIMEMANMANKMRKPSKSSDN